MQIINLFLNKIERIILIVMININNLLTRKMILNYVNNNNLKILFNFHRRINNILKILSITIYIIPVILILSKALVNFRITI